MEEKLKKIISFYGLPHQLKYIHSEYFELDEAIINWQNDGETYFDEVEESHKREVAGEIADIMVMLKQFQYYYKIPDEQIENIMTYKIDRQLERIKNGKDK